MKITFIFGNQSEREVQFAKGQSIHDIAENANVPIHGTCEGNGICGGCHVIIENLNDKLPKISDGENDALDNATGITMKSRLACQIIMTEELDGLRVKIPVR